MDVPPAKVLRTLPARIENGKAPAHSANLAQPRWKSVCAGMQVFRKNCVNCSANAQQKRRPKAPLNVPDLPASLQVLAKQLALRELERLARLRPAVLLALDHARVAGEEAALFQNAAQIGFEIGQRLGDAVTHRPRP